MKFRRKNTYNLYKVKIVSDFELDSDQINSIINIINNAMTQGFYEPGFHISRNVYYFLKEKNAKIYVKTYFTRKGKARINITTK